MRGSGMSRMMWTETSSRNGGPNTWQRRALNALITFAMQDEVTPTVEYLVEEVVDTQTEIVRTMDYLVDEISELHAILHEEPDL